MSNIYKSLVCASFLFLFGFSVSDAAFLYSRPVSTEGADGAYVFDIYMEPEEEVINVAEGSFSLKYAGGEVDSVEVLTGGSAISRWIEGPIYNPENQAISFVGGFLSPVSEEEKLFRVKVYTEHEGELTLTWFNASTYKADGEGTLVPTYGKNLRANISGSDIRAKDAYVDDNEPPEFDTIRVGQDDSLYNGKKFLSIHATDDDSGIDRYVVFEHGEQTVVRNGVYELQDPENLAVTITAYDKAGNSVTTRYPDNTALYMFLGAGVIVLFFVLIFIYVYKKRTA